MASLKIRPAYVAVTVLAAAICVMWSAREVVMDTEALPEHQHSPQNDAHCNPIDVQPDNGPLSRNRVEGRHDSPVENAHTPAARESSADLGVDADPAAFEFAPADTDLTPAEAAQAIRDFDAERAMWLRLVSLDATIHLKRSEDDFVEGRIQVTREEANPGARGLPWSFRVVVTDKEGKWQFSTDGTPPGTALRCDDSAAETRLRPYLDTGIFWTVLSPCFLLAESYDGGADRATAKHTDPDTFFRTVRPWHSRDSSDANSYSFFRGPVPANIITLEQGHIRSWRKGLLGSEPVRLTFAAHTQSNGMWFPTRIEEVRNNVPVRTYLLHHVSIGLSPNSSP